ncbi:MAG TPA: hypothetical protein VHZ78_14685 [Rhizomicrobium sp.]|jgi:hypothetical protein|nr:hypothetical protein [Rhizomicrobium sp.]
MRKVHRFALAGLIVLGAAPAFAADTALAATDSVTPDRDKIVCRTTPAAIGSLLGAKRECATQREWDQRREDAQRALSDRQIHVYTTASGR